MKVIDWVDGDDYEVEAPLGGLGGWFGEGDRWEDYLAIWDEVCIPYAEALRESIIENNIRFGGDTHQTEYGGTPLFDDGSVASFSFRGWGDLLAAVWSSEEDKDYSYMDFYMTGWGDECKSIS